VFAALQLQPLLRNTATEAVIGAVPEKIDETNGNVSFEETMGA